MPESFYIKDGDAWISTRATRGPWSPDHQHAGPPIALLARAMEQIAGEGFRFVRINVEIPRPVPIARLQVTATLDRSGKSVRYLSAELRDEAGTLLIQATGVAMREAEVPMPDYELHDPVEMPLPDQCDKFEYPFKTFSSEGYDTAMQKQHAKGEFLSGKCAVWFRMKVALVAGETPSALQRVMVAADSGSGISMLMTPEEYTFPNPDLTVYLRRYPQGEWICLDGLTVPHESGIGITTTHLRDEEGLFGEGLQSLLINKRA